MAPASRAPASLAAAAINAFAQSLSKQHSQKVKLFESWNWLGGGGQLPASSARQGAVGDLRVNCDEPSSDETRRRFFPSSFDSGSRRPGGMMGKDVGDCRPVIRTSANGLFCCCWRRAAIPLVGASASRFSAALITSSLLSLLASHPYGRMGSSRAAIDSAPSLSLPHLLGQ